MAIQQNECFEAGLAFAREGILPAPEATHAIAEVLHASGKLKDHELTDAEVKVYLKELEGYPTAV